MIDLKPISGYLFKISCSKTSAVAQSLSFRNIGISCVAALEKQFVVTVVKIGEVSLQNPAQNFFSLVQVNKAVGLNATTAGYTNERRQFVKVVRHGARCIDAKIFVQFKDRDTVKRGRFAVNFHGVHIDAPFIKDLTDYHLYDNIAPYKKQRFFD